MGAGTGFIHYSLIPVIYAVASFNKVRPGRPSAVAGTASQLTPAIQWPAATSSSRTADRFAEAGAAWCNSCRRRLHRARGGGPAAGTARTGARRDSDAGPDRAVADTTSLRPPRGADAYDGYIHGGTCARRATGCTCPARDTGDHTSGRTSPAPRAGEPVTRRRRRGPRAGFRVRGGARRSDLLGRPHRGGSGDAVACGDILAPDPDGLTDAGVALVHLQPIGDRGV